MPRGVKCRRICFEPDNRLFVPVNAYAQTVTLSMEELEALRLVDMEGLEQAEAAARMEVSRGTIQRILYSARFKVADALTQGKAISIEGGNYQLSGECDGRRCCCKHCGKETILS